MLRRGRRLVKSPFAPFLDAQGAVVLDGGLATTLESYGFDLNDPLWSARVLLEAPEAVRRVHMDFLEAGADCITTVTYQATHAGMGARGLSEADADEQLLKAVSLAVAARDEFWADPDNRGERLRPLVAGSIGPYGAYLADGSEYRGRYGLSTRELRDFHERRWRVLAGSDVDLLACETIPSAAESEALLSLLSDSDDRWAWMSFNCRDRAQLADGTSFVEAAYRWASAPRVAAVGANCVPAALVPQLLEELAQPAGVPLIVYPNSGEEYDSGSKTWSSGARVESLTAGVGGWLDGGARVVGGCCRVGPAEIRRLRSEVVGPG